MEAGGLTDRFRNKMLLPEKVNGVWSLLMGPGHHAYNPMIAFSLFDQFKGSYVPDASESSVPGIGRALGVASQAGFTPAPWIDIPLNIAGIYGAQDSSGLSRHGDAIARTTEALTGSDLLDIEPTKRISRALRNAIGLAPETETVSNTQMMDRSINTELREMALEDTGNPQATEYVVAATQPDSPLYQEARRRAVSKDARRQVQGTLNPLPYTVASDEQMRAMGDMPDTGDADLSPIARRLMTKWQHPATDFWSISDNRTSSEIQAGFRLGDEHSAENRNALVEALGLQGYNDYIAWLRTVPRGRERTVRAFLASR